MLKIFEKAYRPSGAGQRKQTSLYFAKGVSLFGDTFFVANT